MDEPDPQLSLRLTIGLAASLVAHALLAATLWLPWPWAGGETAADKSQQKEHEQTERKDEPAPRRERVVLGQARSEKQTVAWISHAAYQQMIAPQGRTRQPALQEKAKPIQRAPVELDPTPPMPKASEPAKRAAGEPPTIDALGAARPTPGLPQTPTESGTVSFRPEHVDQPGPTKERTTPNATRQGGRRGTRMAHAKQIQRPSQPTAAPKSDKESPTPRQIDVNETERVRLGEVVAREGIEIKTKAADFSAVALASSLPTNPRVKVTFDPSGEVIDAELLRSSGFDNVDSPVLSSLYQWEASGPRVAEAEAPFSVTINVILAAE
jgi:TonB family protein